MFNKPERFDIPYYVVTLNIDIYPTMVSIDAADQTMPDKGRYLDEIETEFIEFTQHMFAEFDADNGGKYLIRDNKFTDDEESIESEYLVMYRIDHSTGAVYAKYAYIVRLTTHRLPRTNERRTTKYLEDRKKHNQEWANDNAIIPNKLPQQYKTVDIIVNIDRNYRGKIFSDMHLEYDNYSDAEQQILTEFSNLLKEDDPNPDTYCYSNYFILLEGGCFNVYDSKYQRVGKLEKFTELKDAVAYVDGLNMKGLTGSTELTSDLHISDDAITEISDYVVSEVNHRLFKYGRSIICLDAYVEDDNLFIMDVIDTEDSMYTAGIRFSDLDSDEFDHQRRRLVNQIVVPFAELYRLG